MFSLPWSPLLSVTHLKAFDFLLSSSTCRLIDLGVVLTLSDDSVMYTDDEGDHLAQKELRGPPLELAILGLSPPCKI